jgi:hypothetical protein
MMRILRTLILSALLVQALAACNLPVATTTSTSGLVGTYVIQTGNSPSAPSSTNNEPAVPTMPATAPASPHAPSLPANLIQITL